MRKIKPMVCIAYLSKITLDQCRPARFQRIFKATLYYRLISQYQTILNRLYYCRNARLTEKGFKPPKAYSTGTTIAGIIFKVGTLFETRLFFNMSVAMSDTFMPLLRRLMCDFVFFRRKTEMVLKKKLVVAYY